MVFVKIIYLRVTIRTEVGDTNIQYWTERDPKGRRSFRTMLGDDRIISRLLSLRAGSEAFLKGEIDRVRSETGFEVVKVLDIACGWGVSFAASGKAQFYGVDIPGFPKSVTISNGYIDAQEYGENLEIPYADDLFDICTIVNLNAHIPTSLYSQLLDQARKKLKPNGVLLIVAELDNNGLSYSLMRSLSPTSLDRMVAGMDHTNFLFESEFDQILAESKVTIGKKLTVVGNMLPVLHYISWAFNKSPYDAFRYPAFIVDAGLSLFDNVLTILRLGGPGRRFIVGYRCRFHRQG